MKFLLSILAIFAFGAVSIEARAVAPNVAINCYIRHLKDEKILDESYPSYDGMTIAVTDAAANDCDQFIKDKEREIYEATTNSLAATLGKNNLGGLKLVEQVQCIKSKLEKTQFINNNFLFAVYKLSTRLTPEDKTAKKNEMLRKNFDLAQTATQSCILNGLFAANYDKILASSSSTFEKDPNGAYCVRKFVVENHLIDARYEVRINPNNVEATLAFCEETMQQISEATRTDMVNQLSHQFRSESAKACINENIKQKKLSDRIIAIMVLGEVNMSDEQNETEKKNFVDYLAETVSSTNKCVDFSIVQSDITRKINSH